MERETGIEPATNSLEGCDSTTELLPPSFTYFALNFGEADPPSFTFFASELRRGKPADRFLSLSYSFASYVFRPTRIATGLPTCISRPVLLRPSSYGGRPPLACERRLVAREGLEPSKPLGRQIYSLLRLTASLPRQESV